MVIAVAVGALGAIAEKLPSCLAEVPEAIMNFELRKSALLRIVQVLQCVLRLQELW